MPDLNRSSLWLREWSNGIEARFKWNARFGVSSFLGPDGKRPSRIRRILSTGGTYEFEECLLLLTLRIELEVWRFFYRRKEYFQR